MNQKKTYMTLAILVVALGFILVMKKDLAIKVSETVVGTGKDGKCSEVLTREVLQKSLQLGTSFMLNNQYPAGNFTYEYDWKKKVYTKGDNQVRQAGAMWGLALIHQYQPSMEVASALEKAMAFFEKNSKIDDKGGRYIVYPGDPGGSTGTVSLAALAHIDFLREVQGKLAAEKEVKYRKHLDEYLKWLVAARRDDGLWHSRYRNDSGQPFGPASPYFDGESLLALVKAAKYLGKTDLWELIIKSADAGYKINIEDALKKDPDSNTTKGYYQWSSMAFSEIATSGRPNTNKYGSYVVDLADWMIDVHKTLSRSRNTGYAYEGIVHAYKLADTANFLDKKSKFKCVIEKGLEKLTSWQVGSPIANKHITSHPTDDPKAIGGVQNHSKDAPLRIDVAQHQMHAVILALKYAFP